MFMLQRKHSASVVIACAHLFSDVLLRFLKRMGQCNPWSGQAACSMQTDLCLSTAQVPKLAVFAADMLDTVTGFR